ncbi:MAG: DNA adenine methylase [Spirochaetes bacterium]|nr:DNA adenine methylase [Spirochaetota bacterium]
MNKDVQKNSINAIFGWIGGKRLLRQKIALFVPEQDLPIKKRKLKYYVEVFGGVAWMLLFKERWFESEVYNDYNNELTNLFNVIKFHPKEFIKQFNFLPQSQIIFDYLLDNETLTDIQKAVKTYFKYAYSFSSNGNNFSFKPASRRNLFEKINLLSERLDKVVISNKSYDKIIPRFNKENSFLYLDPPYYEKEYLYETKFSVSDHTKLCELLKTYKGKFILSYNDHSEIKKLYSDFNIKQISTLYSAFRDKSEKTNELIIMNY